MNRFYEVFGNSPVFLPVIHVVDALQMQRNLRIVFENGGDGAFLIGHSMDTNAFLQHYQVARTNWPERWIGVNCLGVPVRDVFRKLRSQASGIWTDNAEIVAHEEQYAAERIDRARGLSIGCQTCLYFGGVAFKGQPLVPAQNLATEAKAATRHMDVLTTSGKGTGIAAEREKLVAIREAAGDFPIGLASGVTPDNVRDYAGLVDAFLVASSFTTPGTEMIRLDDFKAMAEAIRAL